MVATYWGERLEPVQQLKDTARKVVEDATDELVSLSHAIHQDPELSFDEHRSAAHVARALEARGFAVETGVADLPTALRASSGSGPLRIAVCAEYDALPEIGHACGHNVIAAAAVGAALSIASVADQIGVTVELLGTPAEEGGGGKIIMLDTGVFDGVHAAMMVHPAAYESSRMRTLAVAHLKAGYTGKQSHASMHPDEGINALDAVVVAQVAIGLLRQHLRPGDQVHGIVSNGGEAANIVPGYAEATFMVRSPTLAGLEMLLPRIHGCLEAGAKATGASLSITPIGPNYSEMAADADLTETYVENARALGRRFPEIEDERPGGSTDMANVSLVLPVIHPMLDIGSLPAVNHQPAFTAAAAAPAADKALIDGAIAMAWTAIDAATNPSLRARLLAGRLQHGSR